jgi:cytochrome c oxidase cbb3-type subunit III
VSPPRGKPAALPLLALIAATACGRGEPRAAAGSDTTSATAQASGPPSVRYEQHISAGGTPPPSDSLPNPFRADRKSAAEGEKLFSSMNCDGCHGGGATGWVGPSLSDGRWRYGGSDAAIFQSIYYGRPRGMPAFGGILSRELTWKLVTYLESLPLPKVVPTQSW